MRSTRLQGLFARESHHRVRRRSPRVVALRELDRQTYAAPKGLAGLAGAAEVLERRSGRKARSAFPRTSRTHGRACTEATDVPSTFPGVRSPPGSRPDHSMSVRQPRRWPSGARPEKVPRQHTTWGRAIRAGPQRAALRLLDWAAPHWRNMKQSTRPTACSRYGKSWGTRIRK